MKLNSINNIYLLGDDCDNHLVASMLKLKKKSDSTGFSYYNIKFNLSRISYHNHKDKMNRYVRIILGSYTGIVIDSSLYPYRRKDNEILFGNKNI